MQLWLVNQTAKPQALVIFFCPKYYYVIGVFFSKKDSANVFFVDCMSGWEKKILEFIFSLSFYLWVR